MRLMLSFLTLWVSTYDVYSSAITDENLSPSFTSALNLSTCNDPAKKAGTSRKRTRHEDFDTPSRTFDSYSNCVSILTTDSISPRRPTFEFSEAKKKALLAAGISEAQIFRIELLQSAFLRSPHGELLNPSSYFKQSELDEILQKISTKELGSMIHALKTLYAKKIPFANLHPNVVYTPALRLSCDDSRGPLGYKKVLSQIEKSRHLNLQHVTGYTFLEEETPETPEERANRHSMQAQLFQTLEAKRGISVASRASELDSIATSWSEYFQYMQLRKDAIEQCSEPKIRSSEIEEVFSKFVAKHYESMPAANCIVYFRRSDIDFQRMSTNNISNLSLLLDGLAPIGADGHSMNLHHLTRRHPGVLVLLPETFHQKHSELLHFRSPQHMVQPKPVDRNVFNKWKESALKALGEHLQTPESPLVEKQLNFLKMPLKYTNYF